MKNIQALSDKSAITLSLLCAIHCMVLPLVMVLLPSFSALPFDGEAFHLWLLLAVIPTSLYAMTMGCKKHKRYQLLALCLPGLAILIIAAALGEHTLGEFWEKGLTLIGALLLASGHVWNYRLCQQANCACTDSEPSTI